MRKSLSYISIVSRADTMCGRAVKASIAFCIAWKDAFKKLDNFFVFGLAVHSILGDKMLHSHTGQMLTHLAKLRYLHLNWSLLGTSLLWGGSKYFTGTPVSNVDISSELDPTH